MVLAAADVWIPPKIYGGRQFLFKIIGGRLLILEKRYGKILALISHGRFSIILKLPFCVLNYRGRLVPKFYRVLFTI